MNLALIAAAVIGIFIAYVNGANDVSKGIATLAGSGITNYRRAILWGAVWATLGSIASLVFAPAMVSTFGKGLLSPNIAPNLPAAVASCLGAALWVSMATRFGLPVSTTHAIVGSMAGVGITAYGIAKMRWAVLGAKVALPLLLSPVASLTFTSLMLGAWQWLHPSAETDCLCAQIVPAPGILATSPSGIALSLSAWPGLRVSHRGKDDRQIPPNAVPITLNHLHWFTSASTSFSRGLNDAPKMVALVAFAFSGYIHGSLWAYLLIAVGILVGSMASGRRVTTTMAERITPMGHREGFTANLITAALVGPGAVLGLPMSTTHVASGAIIGVGLRRNEAIHWRVIKEMALAWAVTVPTAAVLGILAYGLLRVAGIR